MRFRSIIWCSVVALAFMRVALGQSFVNLDFNSVNVPAGTLPSQPVPISEAIPGWTGYLGTTQVTDVLFNSVTLGAASIDIDEGGHGTTLDQYPYNVVLQPGQNPFGSGAVSASISQTGLVPANARSLQFNAYDYQGPTYPAPAFYVSFAGQILNLSMLETESYYTLYGADISSFAGQVGALTITTEVSDNYEPYYFNSLVFSPSSVPEPSVMSLAIICIILGCWCRTRSNTTLEPTASQASGEASSQFDTCGHDGRGSAYGR